MSVNIDFALSFKADEQGAGDLGVPRKPHILEFLKAYASGTGTNQFDLIWSDERTLVATTDSLDVVGGITDAFGVAISMAKLTGFLIWNKSTTTGYDLIVGNGTNPIVTGLFNAAADRIKVKPGGLLLWLSPVDGVAVAAGASDVLKIDSGSNTITYQVILLGRSA